MKKIKTLQTHVVTCPASKFVLTVLLPSGAEKFPVSEAGDCRASSGNFAERGVAGRKRNFAPGAFGSFGQTKEQGKNGNGKKIIQHTEQSAIDTTHKRIEVRKAGVTPLTAASAPPLPHHQRWQRAVRKESRAGYPKGQLDIIARSLPRSANS